jgi:hypothetical protein
MTDKQNYAYYNKVAWILYTVLAIAVIAILVLFVAQDNEERFFYGLMGAGVAYVFRPTNKFFGQLIFKFTGVSQPEEKE